VADKDRSVDFSVNFDQYKKEKGITKSITPKPKRLASIKRERTKEKEERRAVLAKLSQSERKEFNEREAKWAYGSDLYYHETGQFFLEKGFYKKAQKEFQNAIKQDSIKPFKARSHFGLGLAYAYQHKFDKAIEEHLTAIDLNPWGLPEVYYSLASIYALKSENDKAIQYLEKAIKKGYKGFDFVKIDSDFDSIRNDHRYVRLMQGK